MPYHVRITHHDLSRRSHDTLALDKDDAWIAEHVVQPRRQGRDTFIDGRVITWDDVDELHITWTDQPSPELLPLIAARRQQETIVVAIPDAWFVASEGQDVTERFISGPPGARPQPAHAQDAAHDPAAVMVVHGQDTEANRALFDWLRSIGLRPKEWGHLLRETHSASPFVGAILDEAFTIAQAVVVLFTPDERVSLHEELSGRAASWRLQARPNVLLEAGMALATHPQRTVLAVLGEQSIPSDLAGRHYVRLLGVENLRDLAQRLEDAGCPVDRTGDHWLDFSRFPSRDERAPEPRLSPSGDHDDRRDGAYKALLAAHGAMVQAYSGEHIYDKTIAAARRQFDDAQSAVMIYGSPEAREAAEALLNAWKPRVRGRYMGSDWQEDLNAARRRFLQSLAG